MLLMVDSHAALGLVAKLRDSRRYRFLPHGHSLSVVFLKLFERPMRP
jgi:hypothetical protein